MATAKKRKSHGAKKTHHRRRIGAAGAHSHLLLETVGVLGGIVASNMLASKTFPNIDTKIKGAVLGAGGVLLGSKWAKTPLTRGLSLGLAAGGGAMILKGFGVLSGANAQPFVILPGGQHQLLSGTGIQSQVSGGGVMQQVSGARRHTRAKTYAHAYGGGM